MESLAVYGYAGLFLAAFLAATILPFSSEIVLSILLLKGLNMPLLVLAATSGNVLGALANYGIGRWGSMLFINDVWGLPKKKFNAARQRFKTFGTGCIFFAWVPVIGDPLTVIAGVLRISIPAFLILVTSGKLIRYLVIAYIFIPAG